LQGWKIEGKETAERKELVSNGSWASLFLIPRLAFDSMYGPLLRLANGSNRVIRSRFDQRQWPAIKT